ncbi:MAG: GAF domain-containing protein, partial [Desulfobulbaceae bacterium]|nr:GAF domain-containing protein [Desulfobulbaceae bacterium]
MKDQSKTKLFEYLLTVSRHMAENQDLDHLLSYTMDQVLQLMNAERGYIVLTLADNSLDIKIKRRQDGTDVEQAADEISTSILQEVFTTGVPLILKNAVTDPRFKAAESIKNLRLRSVLCVPLITRRHIIGVIYLENRSIDGLFTAQDLIPLELFASQAATLIENARLYQAAQYEIAERKQAETKLAEERNLLQTLID